MRFFHAVTAENRDTKSKCNGFVILFFCLFSLYSSVYSGESEINIISIQFKDTPLRTVFERLAQDNQFNFIFDDALVSDIIVTCRIVNETPATALKKLLEPYRCSCEFLTRKTIIIHRSEEVHIKYVPGSGRTNGMMPRIY